MNLPVQNYHLSGVDEAGLDLAGFAPAGVPSAQRAVTVIGQRFAFHNEPPKVEAQRERIAGEVSGAAEAQMPARFLQIVLTTCGTGLLLLIFTRPIKKLMVGVE